MTTERCVLSELANSQNSQEISRIISETIQPDNTVQCMGACVLTLSRGAVEVGNCSRYPEASGTYVGLTPPESIERSA